MKASDVRVGVVGVDDGTRNLSQNRTNYRLRRVRRTIQKMPVPSPLFFSLCRPNVRRRDGEIIDSSDVKVRLNKTKDETLNLGSM